MLVISYFSTSIWILEMHSIAVWGLFSLQNEKACRYQDSTILSSSLMIESSTFTAFLNSYSSTKNLDVCILKSRVGSYVRCLLYLFWSSLLSLAYWMAMICWYTLLNNPLAS